MYNRHYLERSFEQNVSAKLYFYAEWADNESYQPSYKAVFFLP